MSCLKKASDYGISEFEYKIICDQIERRKKCREEFLKLKTDPCLHSKESGYVFDPALQKFLSMKDNQLQHFQANFRTRRFGLLTILPMLGFGYLLWKQRTEREWNIRCGYLRYRDRSFKFK